jgi:hypothetical protein
MVILMSGGVNAPANEKNCELCGTHEKRQICLGWLIQILYRKPRVYTLTVASVDITVSSIL